MNGKILKKRTDLDPSTIDLHLITDGDWIEDPATTNDAERKTLYYKKVLTTNSGETTPFADTLKIDDVVATKVMQTVTYEGDYKVLTTTYDYDGLMFVIEAEVDAVQTHNAVAAIKSAWGKDVEIKDGVITSIK